MGRIKQATDTEYLKLWQEFRDNIYKSTPVDLTETAADKTKRMRRLEKNDEEWFRYYFPNFYTSEPAVFHRKSTNWVMQRDELFIVRAWSRELSKSVRGMMEDMKKIMMGRIHNKLMVSNTNDNAVRLLLPYKVTFESNQRLINDYGEQKKYGSWSDGEFVIKKGCAFRAIGWGESPRGTRNDNFRPDSVTIDDIDTDEECRNEDIQKQKMAWIEQALFGTRSISGSFEIKVNGNIIHDDCVVKKLGERADRYEIINIVDEQGNSSWPNKNKQEHIKRIQDTISYESFQKEYMNNPMDGGDTFKDIKYGKVPPLKYCLSTVYADPATSNKDKTSGSDKVIILMAKKGFETYIVKCWLDTMSTSKFIDCLFESHKHGLYFGAQNLRVWVENNSLQDPYYEQIYLPLIYQKANETKVFLPITPDTRNKGEKWSRIEATLEPLNRLGNLIFNEAEKDDPSMKRLVAQFKNASRKQKRLDGPDAVEGGEIKLREMAVIDTDNAYMSVKRTNNKRF